jgi:hypothetical protein
MHIMLISHRQRVKSAPEVSYGVSSTALASAPMAHSAAAAPGAFWRSATEPQGAARCCKVLQWLATV